MNENQNALGEKPMDGPMTDEQRRSLYEAACTEADGLYKQIVTIATVVLGASLFVIEKLRPAPPSASFWLMAVGGSILLTSLSLTLVIRFRNIRSMALVAGGARAKAKSYDKRNIGLTWIAIFCVTAGILLMGLSVVLAAAAPNPEKSARTKCAKGKTAMSKEKEATPPPDKKVITEKAIPTSSFFPEQDTEPPQQPEQPAQPAQPQSGDEAGPSQGSEGGQDGKASGSDRSA